MYYHFVAYQIRPVLVKCNDNSQKFFLNSGVVQLGLIQCSIGIVDGMKYSISFLSQHCPYVVVGISKRSFQSCVTTIGVGINFSFKVKNSRL